MHSQDLRAQNIEKLKSLFPNCVAEAKNADGELVDAIDFNLLKQELSDHIVEGAQERYQLDWPGKRQALLTANAPIAKTLRPARDESVDFDTTKNLFIEGDNLDALKLLQETYLNKVKMIYIDPPYNTGNDFIYNDDFAESTQSYFERSNQIDQEGNRLVANNDSNGRFHSDWLSMMYPRLKLARNLLRDDGVIFISIDDNEIDNLKKLCNEIFGEFNFRNIFTLKRYDKNLNLQFIENGLDSFNTGFEYVIAFSKTVNFKFSPVYRENTEDRKKKGYWKGFWNNADRPTMRYDILGYTPLEGQWKWSKEKSEKAVENYIEYLNNYSDVMSLEEYWSQTGKSKNFIRRNENGSGKNRGVENWIAPTQAILRNTSWQDIFASKNTAENSGLFDFPKNPDAIKLMIKSSGADNDIILDFFAGSGTTAHAVMQLNAEDGGRRQSISIQLPEPTATKSNAFKEGYKTIADISRERIRRAGQTIKEKHMNSDLDVGFRVLKVDTSNMKDVYYRPDELEYDDLLSTIDNIKADRTAEDLLFQVMIDWGIDLTLPIKKQTIASKAVYCVGDNALIACFEPDIGEDMVKELAELRPLRIEIGRAHV